MLKKYLLAVVLFATTMSLGFSEIYKWTDKQGNVHFGDQPPDDSRAEELDIKTEAPKASPDTLEQETSTIEKEPVNHPVTDEVTNTSVTDYQSPSHQCFENYEEDISGKDIDKAEILNTLSQQDIENLNDLFKAISQSKRGELVKIDCLGTISEPRQTDEIFDAHVSGKWSLRGQLELEMTVRNKTEERRQYYWWLIDDDKLYFGDRQELSTALRWVVDIEFISQEKLVISKKIYLPNVKQVQVKELGLSSGGFVMTELFYNHGLLTSMYYWRFN